GQTHGGIAAGVGQALWEDCHYASDGQMLAATFMDYALPRADSLPNFTTEISEVPSTTNPLGLRGGGEGGTTPALAATINADVDPKFRDRAPRIVRDTDGKERLDVEGQVLGSQKGFGVIGAIGARQGEVEDEAMQYIDGRKGGFDPHARIPDMDLDGIDAAFL